MKGHVLLVLFVTLALVASACVPYLPPPADPDPVPEDPVDDPVQDSEPLVIVAPDEVTLAVGEWTNIIAEVFGEGDMLRRAYVEELTLVTPIANTPVFHAEPLPILMPVAFEDEDGNEFSLDPAVNVSRIEAVDGGFAFDGPIETRWYLDETITNFDDTLRFGDRSILVEGDRGSQVMLIGGERIVADEGVPEQAGSIPLEVLGYEEVYEGPFSAVFAINGEAFSVEIEQSRTIEVDGTGFTVSFLDWTDSIVTVNVALTGVAGTETTLELPIAQNARVEFAGVAVDFEVIGVSQPLVDAYARVNFGAEEFDLREGDFLAVDGEVFFVDDLFRITIPEEVTSLRLYYGFDGLRVAGSVLERFTSDGEWVATSISYVDAGSYISYDVDYGTLVAGEPVIDPVFGLFALSVETGFGEPELIFEDRSIERDGLSLRPLAPREATLLIEATDDSELVVEHRVSLTAE